MFFWFLACSHRGLVIPGSTKFLGQVWQETHMDAVPSQESGNPSSLEKNATTDTSKALQKEIVRNAQNFLGASKIEVNGISFRYDCSGFVTAVYSQSGMSLSGSTQTLEELSRKVGTFHRDIPPRLGDLVFFDNTYDRNKNGKVDDALTHIAIVEDILANGTIQMIHLGGQGITRLWMNLQHPTEYQDASGNILNSFLRNGTGNIPKMAGEMWVGFSSMWMNGP